MARGLAYVGPKQADVEAKLQKLKEASGLEWFDVISGETQK